MKGLRMTKDSRNTIKIFWRGKRGVEKTKVIDSPFDTWSDFYWQDALDIRELGTDAVWKAIKYDRGFYKEVLNKEVAWCYDTVLPLTEVKPKESKVPSVLKGHHEMQLQESYKLYLDLWVNSECANYAGSMYSDAFKYLKKACKKNGNKDLDDEEASSAWKDAIWINHLINEVLGRQGSSLEHWECWILRDGSIIYLDVVHCKRFVEDYLNLKEKDMEREWVKISRGCVYTQKYD